MPFKSERQRKYLWVHEPEIAHAWSHGKHTTMDHIISKKKIKKIMHPKYHHHKLRIY
jgi:hypothetical protein